LVSGLIGALLSVATTAVFNFWKLHRDEMNSRCDELCRSILDCASAAAEYWATEYTAADIKALRVSEARILGLQSLCDGLYENVRSRLDFEQAAQIDALLSNLLDNVSGGQFSVQNRPTDPTRTAAVLQAASEVVVAIRRAHHSTIPFATFVQTYYENRNRQPDLPVGWIR
jgi:hypothetical protein